MNSKPGMRKINKMRIAIISIVIINMIILNKYTISLKYTFNEENAYHNLEYIYNMGPRTIGSASHQLFIQWASSELSEAGWEVEHQTINHGDYQLCNIIAQRNNTGPWIILGAHYDSRFFADQDPDLIARGQPVPGANDGASGVAILLELAKALPTDLSKKIWIVLFDAEDNGNIPGWDWIIGSSEFVKRLDDQPDEVVIVDMVGDIDLTIYKEQNSSEQLINQIWTIAEELGYNQFVPEYKYQILDDHLPFLEENIQAIDIIDMDYPYWHTTRDTLDKVSSESLDVVGEVLLAWLTQK